MAFLQSPDFFDCVDGHRMSLLKAALKVERGVAEMAGIAVEPITSPQVIVAIEGIVQGVLESLSKNEAPVLTMDNRSSWTNIEFNYSVGLQMVKDCSTRKIRSDCPRSALHFALTMKILSVIYKLVQTDTYATKRDIFYDNVQLYGSQRTVDSIITDISCMLKIPQKELTCPLYLQRLRGWRSGVHRGRRDKGDLQHSFFRSSHSIKCRRSPGHENPCPLCPCY
ncbi:unnamed protein product [Staurois parvus]|uniref:Spo11/DNA topoisomerase VI subunit A N-terminal domain-containing protein n=1 Tax=Staurois parvus TaxID=386267 RepID=A0ABN9FJD5_9NEOB|nr:unnamed protein product [Staurois parvus]